MLDVVDGMYLAVMSRLMLAKNRVKERAKEFWEEEKGSTSTIVVEIVMVGMILVLAYIFREQIGNLFSQLWNKLVHFDGNGKESIEAGSIENPFSNPSQGPK